MVDNAVAFFYSGESSSGACAPHMLDSLLIRSQKIILTNMRQSVSLTVRILRSLYPWVDLDAVGEDFMVTCSNEEDLKLIEDSTVTMGQVAVMSLG
jgi:hypothetical protein